MGRGLLNRVSAIIKKNPGGIISPSHHVDTGVACPHVILNLAKDFSRSVKNKHMFSMSYPVYSIHYCSPNSLRHPMKSTRSKHTESVCPLLWFPPGSVLLGMWVPKSILNFS